MTRSSDSYMFAFLSCFLYLFVFTSAQRSSSCSDTPPPSASGGSPTFSCTQQVGWGKCGEVWMKGYCLQSCFNCQSQPTCNDTPPPAAAGSTQYSCAQQFSWGKCSEVWMQGYCQQTCFNCGQIPSSNSSSATCSDTPPPAASGTPQYTCAQQKGWGKCSEAWMEGYCSFSCFNCQSSSTGAGGSSSSSTNCSDIAPPAASGATQYSCVDQKSFGKCGEVWMSGYCQQSCFGCSAITPSVPAVLPPTANTSLPAITQRLSIKDKRFYLGDQRIFLTGVNQAWNNYGRDIGVNSYSTILEDVLRAVHQNGGNCVRFWLHCDAAATPNFDGNGMVTGLSATTISDLKQYLDVAQQNGIFVILSLFDFMVVRSHANVLSNTATRQSYITNALTPLVQSLKSYPNLIWEIINEPEGCTSEFNGWQTPYVPFKDIQTTANLFSATIHTIDPAALVTLGAWSWKSLNYAYTDAQLIAAGGAPNGVLDFYSVHYYQWMGHQQLSSFDNTRDSFGAIVDRPIIIGEFSQSGSDGKLGSIRDMYSKAFTLGWDGALGWQANGGGENADSFSTLLNGISASAISVSKFAAQSSNAAIVPQLNHGTASAHVASPMLVCLSILTFIINYVLFK